ncbi:MAG: non-canonical purine NTP diphosphatase [Bacteroidetes bacterium]|nr:non-canonical purine NTP diphosphatase [Bacteroidota bacterium]
MELVFATANPNKAKEIQNLIPDNIKIRSLSDIHCAEEIPETQATIEGNASQKAFYVHKKYQVNCFADDTGLEIEALDGRPGVLSARYAGDAKDANANMNKVLAELSGVENRKARFKTVISLVIDNKEVLFEGIVNGRILHNKIGEKGFGYDPIFVPDGYDKTFAELSIEEKNLVSHRAIAVNKLITYLKQTNPL